MKPFKLIVFLSLFNIFCYNLYSQVEWNPIGPGGGGWISAITVINDPLHTLYVGCDVGGVYKSSDNGKSWTIKNNGLSIYFVQDITYDPVNPDILYLATRGGIYKSTNGGDTWTAKRSGFPDTEEYSFSAPINDIVVDPKNNNILYAGIGVHKKGYDFDRYHWDSVEIKGSIYKSIDRGETWTLIRKTGINPEAMIYSMDIDSKNSKNIYAATDKGVYKSTDAGKTWKQKKSGLPKLKAMNIVVDPVNTDTVYVTLWANPGSWHWKGGVYKSINGGDSWKSINNGLPKNMGKESGFTCNYTTLVIDKHNPEVLYTGNMPWTPDPGVYKTTNGGDSWDWITRADTNDKNMDLGWIPDTGVSPMAMTIDPVSSNRILFGTSMHLFETENSGVTWKQLYTKSDKNGYWKGEGFETTCVETISVDPTNSNNVYAGYWDIGFLKSIDGGKSFKKTDHGMRYKDNTFDIIVDPDSPNIIYASCGWWEENSGEVYRSDDYGETWVALNNGIPDAQIWSIALDKNSPSESRILYAASYNNGIYKTIDGGDHWIPVNRGLGVNKNLQVMKILIDPNNSNILYAGLEAKIIENGENSKTIQGGLFKSTNAGDTWYRIDRNIPQISVWDIVIPNENSQIIYTAVFSDYDHTLKEYFYGGVYKSNNGGSSWERLNKGFGEEDNLEISSLAIDPVNSNILYAATTDAPYHDISSGRGIYRSINSGESWKPINNGLGVLYFNSLAIDPLDPSTIYAGSSGNGIYKSK